MPVYGIPDIVEFIMFPGTQQNCVPSDGCTCTLYFPLSLSFRKSIYKCKSTVILSDCCKVPEEIQACHCPG